MKNYQTYFETQNETLNEFYTMISDNNYKFDELDCFQTQHIPYNQNIRYTIELTTLNGNKARKQAHAFICRLSSGRYELTMYIN